MHTTIERELELRLVLSPERGVRVPARLSYRTDDPYAVHFTFHTGSEIPVHWTFSRELLIEGVFRPCGHGDVRVWPATVNAHNVLCVALSSPDGDALLEAPTVTVAAWLERIMRLVPPGSEAEAFDLDEGLATLLSGAPDGARPGTDPHTEDASYGTRESARTREPHKPHAPHEHLKPRVTRKPRRSPRSPKPDERDS